MSNGILFALRVNFITFYLYNNFTKGTPVKPFYVIHMIDENGNENIKNVTFNIMPVIAKPKFTCNYIDKYTIDNINFFFLSIPIWISFCCHSW